jgi:L-threonylcarbamoyladenylate synthase
MDSEQAAHRLYDLLRQLDLDGVESAWVDMDIPTDGLWQTVRERLNRAASR